MVLTLFNILNIFAISVFIVHKLQPGFGCSESWGGRPRHGASKQVRRMLEASPSSAVVSSCPIYSVKLRVDHRNKDETHDIVGSKGLESLIMS